MFDLEQAVTEWRQRMTSAGIASADVLDELESHLRDQITSPAIGDDRGRCLRRSDRCAGESGPGAERVRQSCARDMAAGEGGFVWVGHCCHRHGDPNVRSSLDRQKKPAAHRSYPDPDRGVRGSVSTGRIRDRLSPLPSVPCAINLTPEIAVSCRGDLRLRSRLGWSRSACSWDYSGAINFVACGSTPAREPPARCAYSRGSSR